MAWRGGSTPGKEVERGMSNVGVSSLAPPGCSPELSGAWTVTGGSRSVL